MQTATDIHLIKNMGKISREAIVAYDLRHQRLLYCNDVFLKIFETREAEVLKNPGQLFRTVISGDIPHVKLCTEKLFREGSLTNAECTINADGTLKHLSCSFMVISENDLLFGIIDDITGQRKHDDFAVNFGAQKDTLLDMLTHNLSAPLLLSKEMLATIDRSKDEALTKTLTLLKENTQFCLDIVSDFLRKEHHESVRTHVHRTRFDAVEKIEMTLDKLRAMNHNKRIIFETTYPDLQVTTDAIKFFQVIHNVLSNSVKFTGDGGLIKVTLEASEHQFTVGIHDDGVGIPQEDHKFVFSEGVRVRPGLRGEVSSGLGLNIARRLVEMLEGRIYFESREGRGTTFFITLPRG